ncbi:MAG: hypothetical protein ACKO0V_16120, partial [bacterium]
IIKAAWILVVIVSSLLTSLNLLSSALANVGSQSSRLIDVDREFDEDSPVLQKIKIITDQSLDLTKRLAAFAIYSTLYFVVLILFRVVAEQAILLFNISNDLKQMVALTKKKSEPESS